MLTLRPEGDIISKLAGLAQSVERLIRNHEVASSNLASSSKNSRISRKKREIRYFLAILAGAGVSLTHF